MNNEIHFQLFNNPVWDCTPTYMITLEQMFDRIKNPDDYTLLLLQKIQEARLASNDELKAEFKAKLGYYCPCVVFGSSDERPKGWRDYKHVSKFTGLVVLDFDKISSTKRAEHLKKSVFDSNDSIIAAWISPSKVGFKAIVKIPVVKSIEEFKNYWWGIYYRYMFVEGFDATTKNATLALYHSHDPNILIRNNYTTSNIQAEPAIEEKKIVDVNDYDLIYHPDDEENAYKHIENIINLIDNEGHPLIRSASINAGNYIRWGVVDELEMHSFIHELAQNHYYLSKKYQSAYKKTINWGLQIGYDNPTELLNN